MKCNPTDAAPVVQSPLVEALGRNHATLIREYPRRSESVRALSKGGRLLPPLMARLIPNRAILVASGLPRSTRNAGTCSVGATLGLYSKLMSERVRLRGISLHSLKARYGYTWQGWLVAGLGFDQLNSDADKSLRERRHAAR